MKVLAAAAVMATVCVAGTLVNAQEIIPMLSEGTQSLTASGALDWDAPLGEDLSIEGGYGYFIRDNLQVLGLLAYNDNDKFSTYAVGAGVEYNFPTYLIENRLVPHVGIIGFWGGGDIDAGESADTYGGRLFAGPKLFLAENVALVLDLVFSFAADEIYVTEDAKPQDTNAKLVGAIRYYF